MENPKPCKCGCGGEAKVRASCFFTATDLYLVQCKRCGTATLLKDSEAEAIEAWNTAMSGNKTGERYPRLLENVAQPLTPYL